MRSFTRSSFIMLVALALVFLFGLTASHPHGFKKTTRYEATPTLNTATPCTGGPGCVTATGSPYRLPCEAAYGTAVASTGTGYTLICDIDFPAQNIDRFVLAGSFDECVTQCDAYNDKNLIEGRSAEFVFAPNRFCKADDCWLKSALSAPIYPATMHLVGAMIVPSSAPNTATPASTAASSTSHRPATRRSSRVTVAAFMILGSSTNKPTKQYVSHVPATPQKLVNEAMTPGLNIGLITNYPIANDTGTWTSRQLSSSVEFSDMKAAPQISRDGGKGGTINGTHVFVFCDTANFNPVEGMVGFVSSSVATDDGMKALYGKPLDLVDHVGEWQDDVGRMRGFAPMTTGEETFNVGLSGKGYRYAVWPESSLIPFNGSHAVLYPALVYDVVDMSTQAAVFNDIGNSVLLVSVDPVYGPFAERVVAQLYQQGQVAFGTLGGIRAWGSGGKGGNDGHIYLFGAGDHGVLVARAAPSHITDLTTYQYWTGSSWSSDMPSPASNAVMLDMRVQDLDVIYVPAMHSFLMVYLNTLADNTFYYRHLPLDLNASDQDYDMDHIVTAAWSDEQVLAEIDAPVEGFIYAGGVHAGYFGADDITNGGCKMLITWTEHTGKDAASPESGYAHKSAYVELDFS
jgi:hypothetical protein